MQSSRPIQIGFAPFGQRFTFWAIATQAVKELAAKKNVALSTIPVSDNMPITMIMEQFIQQGVDVAMVMPAFDSEEFVRVVQRALSQNMRVIAFDSAVSDTLKTYHVRPDNIKGAMLSAEYLIGQLEGHGKLVHLPGNATSHSAIVRAQGVHDVVARHPEVQIVFESHGDWSRESGMRLMHEALAKHRDVQGVICGNDLMALGALDAIAAAGRDDKILTVGFDAQSEALRSIRSGAMAATVWQDPANMGRVALELALQLLTEATVPRETITGVTLVTPENLIDATLQTIDLLPAVLNDLVVSTEAQQRLQQEIIATQESIIRELSTPVIPITDEIMVMPLIGTIDSARSQQIMETMLAAISQSGAHVLILDVTGVVVIDTNIANYLLQAARAVRLLGAQVLLAGISPEIAQTIVQLGIDLGGLLTQSTVQACLDYTLKHLVREQKPHILHRHNSNLS
jgi:ribose transport system substrate-binding protein